MTKCILQPVGAAVPGTTWTFVSRPRSSTSTQLGRRLTTRQAEVASFHQSHGRYSLPRAWLHYASRLDLGVRPQAGFDPVQPMNNNLYLINLHVGRGTSTEMPEPLVGAYVPSFSAATDPESAARQAVSSLAYRGYE